MSQQDVETIKTAYEAFGQGDLQGAAKEFTDDVEWWSSPEVPEGGTVNGKDAVVESWSNIPNYFSEFAAEPREFVDAGDKVCRPGHTACHDEGHRQHVRGPIRARLLDGGREGDPRGVSQRQRDGGQGAQRIGRRSRHGGRTRMLRHHVTARRAPRPSAHPQERRLSAARPAGGRGGKRGAPAGGDGADRLVRRGLRRQPVHRGGDRDRGGGGDRRRQHRLRHRGALRTPPHHPAGAHPTAAPRGGWRRATR